MIIAFLLPVGNAWSNGQNDRKIIFSVDFDDQTVTPTLGSNKSPVEKGLISFKPGVMGDRKSTRLNSSHTDISRMPSSA